MVDVDFSSLSDVLKNPIRRKIILSLSNTSCISYVELMNIVEVTNTGRFNYHLKALGDLIQKDATGKYCLTEKGQLANQFIQKFPDKPVIASSMHMSDATLVGFAGVLLTVANPLFILPVLLQIFNFTVLPLPIILAFRPLSYAYSIFIPGYFMWLLVVRRSHSHDTYDLMKPPFIAFLLSLLLLLIIYLTKMDAIIVLTTPVAHYNQYHSSYSGTAVSMGFNLIVGFACSFIGVAFAEKISKIRKNRSIS